MQLKSQNIQITVFKLDNETFDAIGDLSQFTSLIWPDAFNGYAHFEMWAPITEANSELIKKKNVIWTGGENAAIIEIVKSQVDERGEKIYHVKGRTLEKYLVDRLVWGGYTKSGKTSTIMYDLVRLNAINPTDPKRKIPFLVNAADTGIGKQINQYQKTGGELYDALYNLADDAGIGFSILFDPVNKRLVFEVREGVDRTMGNAFGNDPVVFSTELEDILSSSYYSNNEDEKTMALVMGEDTGSARTMVTTGKVDGVGFDRKELFVDARDLQSEVYHEDGSSTVLTPAQYKATLTERGDQKLAEHEVTEVFEAQIRQFGNVQYEFGVDYQKGDKVTVIDEQLMVQVSARITQVEEDFDDEYSLILTFGYSYPTILQKVKLLANQLRIEKSTFLSHCISPRFNLWRILRRSLAMVFLASRCSSFR